jgi:hypothetical protein
MGGILTPAFLAVGIVSFRSVTSSQRIPYPYEFLSVAVIYGGAGLLAELDSRLGAVVAWGYLVALVLAPKQANLLTDISSGIKTYTGTGPNQNPSTAQGAAS